MAELPLIAPGRRYRIAGPEGEWVVLGLGMAGDKAEVQLVSVASYERTSPNWPGPARPQVTSTDLYAYEAGHGDGRAEAWAEAIAALVAEGERRDKSGQYGDGGYGIFEAVGYLEGLGASHTEEAGG